MKTPFDILGLPESATDSDIKKAYLKLIHKFTPDRCPTKFKEIKEAYEQVSTLRTRVHYRLFHVLEPDIDSLINMFLNTTEKKHLNSEAFLKLIFDTSKEELIKYLKDRK